MSEQVKYLNGKIYMIKSENSDKVYIGSTCKSLNERLKKHEQSYKAFKNGKYSKVASFEILELRNYYILLLENVKVETKKELRKIEGNYIIKYPNVNRCIPGRTKKDYYDGNIKGIKEKQKMYGIIKKDEIRQKRKEQINCSCGVKYSVCNKSRHFKSKKHIEYEQNKTLNQ